MFVICDNQNIVRNFSKIARYVKAQSNGVTILADKRTATAIYCEDDNTYWPTKEVLAGQKTYILYEVETVPPEAKVNITRYNVGNLEVDPELQALEQEKLANNVEQKIADLNDKDLDNKMALAEIYEMMLSSGGVI